MELEDTILPPPLSTNYMDDKWEGGGGRGWEREGEGLPERNLAITDFWHELGIRGGDLEIRGQTHPACEDSSMSWRPLYQDQRPDTPSIK